MTTLTAERAEWVSTAREAETRYEQARLGDFDGLGGRLTLDEFIVRAWEGLSAHSVVDCPVCGGPMEPVPPRASERPVGGRCRTCATILA